MAPWHFMRLSSPVDGRGFPHPNEAMARAADQRRQAAADEDSESGEVADKALVEQGQ